MKKWNKTEQTGNLMLKWRLNGECWVLIGHVVKGHCASQLLGSHRSFTCWPFQILIPLGPHLGRKLWSKFDTARLSLCDLARQNPKNSVRDNEYRDGDYQLFLVNPFDSSLAQNELTACCLLQSWGTWPCYENSHVLKELINNETSLLCVFSWLFAFITSISLLKYWFVWFLSPTGSAANSTCSTNYKY